MGAVCIDSSVCTIIETVNTPLYIVADPAEISGIERDSLLVTRVGTLNCAFALIDALTTARIHGNLPSRLVNVGTAGALVDGLSGVFEISHVLKHDFSNTGHPYPNGIDLDVSGLLPTARLATGDSFIGDSASRERISRQASLVDMEGYVVALAGQRFGIPVTLLKDVSDNADDKAAGTWTDALPASSRRLMEALEALAL